MHTIIFKGKLFRIVLYLYTVMCSFQIKLLHKWFAHLQKWLKYRITSKVSSTSNNSRPLIIPATFFRGNRLTVRKNNMLNQAKLYWCTRQVIFVFIRTTVKKFTKNCLGPFQRKVFNNRSGNADFSDSRPIFGQNFLTQNQPKLKFYYAKWI